MVVTDIPSSGRSPTTTLQGWRGFVASTPPTIELVDSVILAAMSTPKRDSYDDQRISYHSEFVLAETSAVRSITNQGRLLMMLNQREISARRGMVVSGPWASGKTTAIKLLGKTHELLVNRKYPSQRDRIPVVYITTPPKGSPKKLASEFANFLGLPYRARQNVTDIADAVCQVLTMAKTDLVIVDEIHNLNLATSAGEDMSDHLKYFTEHMPATFVYAGINVENSGLFTGLRGRQISARSVLMTTGPFPLTEEWDSLVATLEDGLRLHDHVPGTLMAQSQYLHHRTGGSISSLSHLIRMAAILAILNGRERIDRALLDSISLDHAAESMAPRPPAANHVAP